MSERDREFLARASLGSRSLVAAAFGAEALSEAGNTADRRTFSSRRGGRATERRAAGELVAQQWSAGCDRRNNFGRTPNLGSRRRRGRRRPGGSAGTQIRGGAS